MSERPPQIFRKFSAFKWTKTRGQAALLLAQGYTQDEVAGQVGISDRTIRNWNAHPDFAAEVNRLSLMVNIASRAERLRKAMRIVRQMGDKTDKDLLDWLKYAQTETDGVKLDLTTLADAFGLLADGGQGGTDSDKPAGEGHDAGEG